MNAFRNLSPASAPIRKLFWLALPTAWLLAFVAQAGTSPVQPGREPSSAHGASPALPGSKLPDQLPTEPHNAGKRSWMKAGMNNLRQATLLREQNKTQPDIVTLPDGLQYRIRTQGEGPKPKKSDTVEVYFVGSLVDGTVFSSVSAGGKPASFKLADVIPGWREALKMMPVGSKWQIFVPPDLGYGVAGVPPTVGPDAMLIYELELVGIKAKAPKAKSGTAMESAKVPKTGETAVDGVVQKSVAP